MVNRRQPRKPQALPLITDHIWSGEQHEEQDTYAFWFRKARELTPELFPGMSDGDTIPISILAELYPEVIALGPCAPTITKAFNTLKAADRYLERQRLNTATPEYHNVKKYIERCYSSHAFHRGESLENFLSLVEPGNLYKRFDSNFKALKTNRLFRCYGYSRIHFLGVATAGAIHLVHSGATQEAKPTRGIKEAAIVVKAFQELEAFLLKQKIITPEHLTNINLPTKKKVTAVA